MLNPTGWNLQGKCGFIWGGTATVCWILAYFFLPELGHRSYREIDILFTRKVSARKFRSTQVLIEDDH
jgi:SP family general alpha glucoside:H+ symporter-like MFS transporter